MPKPTATAPALPSQEKVTEAKGKLMEKKSKQAASAEEGRRSSVDLRTKWSTSLKKSKDKGKGSGKKGQDKGKAKGKGKGKYKVKKTDDSLREEAVDKLEKTLEKKRRSSIKEIQKIDKSLALQKPSFGKVEDVKPEAKNLNFMLKCVKCTEVEGLKIWEAVCGDETGVVTLSVQTKELADLCTAGASLRIQNAKVIMVKGLIRVAIDKWAVMKAADTPLEFEPKLSNDVSATEYELVVGQ